MAEAKEPKACDECGYGKEHDPDCSQASAAMEQMEELVEAVDKKDAEIKKAMEPEDPDRPAHDMEPPETVMGLRWHGNPAPLLAAFIKAQADFPELERTEQTKFETKGGRTIEYWFAPLREFETKIRPILNENGLGILQPPSNGASQSCLRTLLVHESGSFLECTLDLPAWTSSQDFAGSITQMRRYMIFSMLGIANETDDDGVANREATGEGQVNRSSPDKTYHVHGTEPSDKDIQKQLKDLGCRWDPENKAWKVEGAFPLSSIEKKVADIHEKLTVEVA